ncbi:MULTISPECIES: DUF4190 domain-containing protein [unclassified Arthrobacter]|uniref:DUF4190 domain-containing protein n=1 Tax=unclassified Arthrobacter TaxID=235627 RepID=UPI00159CFBB0|nr:MULTISPECIES: DUF4190 domain-containing protein [unclassified Arthrobacter]MCQ9164715.1 hypothetical protein [Arthrobacter sp. STN4]NVM99250.1 DUF4190 domain-containing protein [Arthrobacter sp. SDTb3-6]
MSSNTPENPYGESAAKFTRPQWAQTPPAPPSYAQGPYGPPMEDPGKTLGIVGLVLCFVVSLAGLIVSIIAKRKSAAAGFTNTPANVGVILGWIFTIIGFVVMVFYIIAVVLLLNNPDVVNRY